jgi:cell wall-associated NlpC family hydrolase
MVLLNCLFSLHYVIIKLQHIFISNNKLSFMIKGGQFPLKIFDKASISLGVAAITLAIGMTAKADTEMFRLYNPNSGEHFYTANAYERDQTVKAGWSDEGTGWVAPDSGEPVYRLYNPNAGDHFYTLSSFEKDSLVNTGWNYEGISWFSGGSVPLYRAYNPNAQAGSHNYTTDSGEQGNLLSVGWNDEGVAWYGVGLGVAKSKPALSPLDDYYLNYAPKLTGTANSIVESAITAGFGYVGNSPYVWGGGRTAASINARHFDCSSFVAWIYASAGHVIDNQSGVTTYSLWNKGIAVGWNDLRRGDLIVFNPPAASHTYLLTDDDGNIQRNKPTSEGAHVVFYLGDGFFLHDSPNSSTGGVGIDRFSDEEMSVQYFAGETWQQLIQNSEYVIRRVA